MVQGTLLSGMSTMVVMPPAAAADVAVSNPATCNLGQVQVSVSASLDCCATTDVLLGHAVILNTPILIRFRRAEVSNIACVHPAMLGASATNLLDMCTDCRLPHLPISHGRVR